MSQHEPDHINEIIFIDKLSDGKIYLRKEVKRIIDEEKIKRRIKLSSF